MYCLPRAALSFLIGVTAGLVLLLATGVLHTPDAEAHIGVAPYAAAEHLSPGKASTHRGHTKHAIRDRKQQRLGEVRNEAKGEELPSDPCERNIQIAASKGLKLPDGWEMHCVGPGLDWDGNTHWGVTCPYSECPEGAGPYVSVSNPTYYVISHELCHANFGNDELMADRCAAEHGASLATSPYN